MFEAYNTIKKYNMIQKNSSIVVGVSGGADSVSLLHFLCTIREKYELRIIAVHVHHGIRAEQADEDLEYVKLLCQQYEVPLEIFKYDIHMEAKKLKLTQEEAGRKKRYEAFEETLKKYNADKIAVAHNMNDQAETLLMRICRGTGLKGLSGILPRRDNIIRPLIECSRESIEEYCNENKLDFKTDYTNDMDIYTRNKIRIHLLPWIKENLNSSIVYTLSKMSGILREEEEYIYSQAENAYRECIIFEDKSKVALQINKVLTFPKVIQKRIFRKAIKTLREDLHDIEFIHIEQIIGLLDKPTGKSINLTEGIIVQIQYDNIYFFIQEGKGNDYYYPLEPNGEVYIKEIKAYIKTQVYDRAFFDKNFKDTYTKVLDYDKMNGKLGVRNRKDGDKINLKGVGNKKLKDFFMDLKIPRQQRATIPIIVSGDDIIWVVGYRISADYMVSAETKSVICIEVMEQGEEI